MSSTAQESSGTWSPLQWLGAVLAWSWVVIPFVYGLVQLVAKIPALFG